jgi:hypothetical protein
MTAVRPPLTCPKCGGIEPYGANFCSSCRCPLTDRGRRQLELERVETIATAAAEIVERAIDRVAADLEISPEAARAVILVWAKQQP